MLLDTGVWCGREKVSNVVWVRDRVYRCLYQPACVLNKWQQRPGPNPKRTPRMRLPRPHPLYNVLYR